LNILLKLNFFKLIYSTTILDFQEKQKREHVFLITKKKNLTKGNLPKQKNNYFFKNIEPLEK